MNGLKDLKSLVSANLAGISQYFCLPTIGGLYSPVKANEIVASVLQLLDMIKFGIPIYPDVYEESGGNDISEQVLVGGIGSDATGNAKPGDDITGALVKVADNIVVNPRKWRIHGYMGFNTNTASGRFFNGLIGEATVQSFVTKFGRDTLNNTFKQTLQYISEARRPFKFHTREGETIPCLIKSYNIKTIVENNNFVEVDLEIQEFRFLALTGDENGNQTTVGGITSPFNVSNLGRTALRALTF